MHTKSEDFGGGVYNYERWSHPETAVALVGLSLSKCRSLESEEDKLKYALQYWVEQSGSKEGMVFGRMPTLDELKRFSHQQGANIVEQKAWHWTTEDQHANVQRHQSEITARRSMEIQMEMQSSFWRGHSRRQWWTKRRTRVEGCEHTERYCPARSRMLR